VVTLADYVSEFIYKTYVEPALQHGEKSVNIDLNELYEALNGAYSRDFLCALLRSSRFCRTYHLAPEPDEITAAQTARTFRLQPVDSACP
jgi:hypothetical protein